MRIAQGLYEAGHITYMRTDSMRTSASSRDKAKNFITSKWGSGFVGKGSVSGKPKSGVQDAHEAIRPTNPLSELPNGLDESQTRLYRLIWSRFIASQMCDSEWTSMKIQAQLETFDKLLDGDTKWRVKPGWESAFEVIDRAPPSSPPSPEITEGSKIKLDNKKFTLNEYEIEILKKISEWPKCVELSSIKLEPHRIPFYLYELVLL